MHEERTEALTFLLTVFFFELFLKVLVEFVFFEPKRNFYSLIVAQKDTTFFFFIPTKTNHFLSTGFTTHFFKRNTEVSKLGNNDRGNKALLFAILIVRRWITFKDKSL